VAAEGGESKRTGLEGLRGSSPIVVLIRFRFRHLKKRIEHTPSVKLSAEPSLEQQQRGAAEM